MRRNDDRGEFVSVVPLIVVVLAIAISGIPPVRSFIVSRFGTVAESIEGQSAGIPYGTRTVHLPAGTAGVELVRNGKRQEVRP